MLNYWYFIPSIFLSPILLIQGLRTKKMALRLPEPQGSRVGQCGKGEKLRLLILGDSAGAGVGVDHQDQALAGQLVSELQEYYNVKWQLIAESGRTTQDTIDIINTESQQNVFDLVLISLGVNDVTSLVSTKKWIKQCEQLVYYIEQVYKAKRIIWSDLPEMGKFTAMPQPLRWVIGKRKDQLRKALVEWIAQNNKVELLEFPDVFSDPKEKISDWIATDGFHPGEKTYALWGELAAQKIRSLVLKV